MRNVPSNGLPMNAKHLLSQKCDLTAEVGNRDGRAPVTNVAYNPSAILRLELIIPEIIQRNLAR